MLKKYIVTFLISMVPILELRFAVPLALDPDFLGGALPVIPAFILCVIGNMIPVPFVFFFARKILTWGSEKKFIGKLFKFFLKKGEKGGKKLQEKAGKGLYVALFLFVGIPFPGTGAWTGTLAASFLDMDFKKSCVAVVLGVILAGTITGVLYSICGIAALGR